jgi:hypothetical protein
VHLVSFFGEQPVDAIEPEDVIDLVALLERKRRAPATVRVVVATLSALFVFAKAPYRRWATVNPCEGPSATPTTRRASTRERWWRRRSCARNGANRPALVAAS